MSANRNFRKKKTLWELHKTKYAISKNKRTYVCIVCDKSFLSAAILRMHSYYHTGGDLYLCEICNEEFLAPYQLQRHIVVHTGFIATNTCEFCNKTYSSEKTLITHKALHTSVKVKTCDTCHKLFSSKRALNKHKEKSSSGDICKCSVCKQIFFSICSLEKHIQTHSKEVQNMVCNNFLDGGGPLIHIINKNNFWCNICDSAFNLESDLEAHNIDKHKVNIQTHDKVKVQSEVVKEISENIFGQRGAVIYVVNQKEILCNICDSAFNSQLDLEAHKIKKHDPLKVQTNGKETIQNTVDNESSENVFESSETAIQTVNNKDILCSPNISDSLFNLQTDSKAHKVDKHKRGRHHICDVCGRGFSRMQLLDYHYREHIGGTPYICEVCSISFSLECSLDFHNDVEHPPNSDQTNAKWKRLSCPFCNLRFVRKVYYVRHIKTHNKKNPFQCDECRENFNSQSNLDKHYLVHVDEHYEQFEVVASHGCSDCFKIFSSLPELQSHKLSHHDSQPLTPLTLNSEVIDKMLSDVSKHEVDFIFSSTDLSEDQKNPTVSKNISILSSDHSSGNSINVSQETSQLLFVVKNTTESNPQNTNNNSDYPFLDESATSVQNIALSSESEQIDSIISNCTVVQGNENGIETLYIISENADGTIETSILDSNSVIVVDSLQQVKDIAEDIELTGSIDDCESFVQDENDASTIATAASEVGRKHLRKKNTAGEISSLKQKQEKVWNCTLCEKRFTTKQNLTLHCYEHTGDKPYPCDFCEKSFTKKTALNNHLGTHSKPYACDECKRSFSTRDGLKRHSMSHHGAAKPFPCNMCDKTFTQKSSLQMHEMIHTGYRPFKCDICGKGFKAKYVYEMHLMMHRGEKLPHTCEDCGVACISASLLKTHRFKHTGVKPYQCDRCPKSFTTKGYLQNHYVTHTKKGKHYCGVCGKPFYLVCEYVKHVKYQHTEEKSFLCEICGQAFVQEQKLRYHISMKHKT